MNRGTSTALISSATSSSRTFCNPSRSSSAPSTTTRRALTSWHSHSPTLQAGSAPSTRLRMIPSWRKFSPTNSSKPRPSISLRFGTRAVCGIGSPSGCLNRATTANQSAMAPTMEASAPAFTKPRKPSWPSVARYTAAARTSRPTARARMRRRADRRSASSPGSALFIANDIAEEPTRSGCGDTVAAERALGRSPCCGSHRGRSVSRGSLEQLGGEHRGLRATLEAQLGEDAGDVVLDGLLGQEELLTDLAVRQTLGHELEDAPLLRRQRTELGRLGGTAVAEPV